MTISGNAIRIQRCREKKARYGLERVEITLGKDIAERLREEARYQKIPFHRLIGAILADHLRSGRRIWG